MRKLSLALGLSLAALLGACGGGGGSPGDTQLVYTITLRADRTQLPTNIEGQRAGIGAYAPYTTTLHVEAREGGKPIPGLKDAFACNLAAGLETGALYYLDGDDEHEDEDGNALAFRNITLDSNSGGNSFHFHSGNKSGAARITCSITNPRDNQVSSASVDIVVGGDEPLGSCPRRLPASVVARAQAPGFLGSRDNTGNILNRVAIQASLMDDGNQPVPNPAAANLQVSILPSSASDGARLLVANQPGKSVIQMASSNGLGQFSLASGPNRGVIVLALTTDRADNNVSNGIQDAVTQLMAVSVVDAVATAPLAIVDAKPAATNGASFAFGLQATGGVLPYSWSSGGGLPAGLSLGSSGIISGTPKAPAGDYNFVATVTDSNGATQTANLVLTLTGDLPPEPLSIVGCTGAVNTPCALPDATSGAGYAYIFSAAGGDPATAVAWTYRGLPAWLTGGATTGAVTGTAPVVGACTGSNFLVTATRGTVNVTRNVTLRVCP